MNWRDLAELRAAGQRPMLPVIVTTWPVPWRPHARELFARGVMVISHQPGEPAPVRLLQGLRVILAFQSCDQTMAFGALLKRRGVRPASLHAWCACYREFTAVPDTCQQTHDQVRIVESLPGGNKHAA